MSASTTVTRTERLLNLVIALLAARSPVSRRVIQEGVAGYDPTASTSTFERMFERDKDELRAMGIPIETIADAHGEVQGYLIDSSEYRAREVSFDGEELAALNLAALVWDNAVLESTAITAIRKIESMSPSTSRSSSMPGAEGTSTTFGHVSAQEAALLPLMRAVRDKLVVRFNYRKPGSSEVDKRSVEPWSLYSRQGRWYLNGLDLERNAERLFRISRIEGAVTVTATAASERTGASGTMQDTPTEDDVTALVRIPEGVGAELRRHRTSTLVHADTFSITDGEHRLLELLWRADPGVQILGPEDLVAAFESGLSELESAHR